MVFILFALATFFIVFTTAIFKNITKRQKFQVRKRTILVVSSATIYILLSIYLLYQPYY